MSTGGEPGDEKYYTNWLGFMWDVQKFDILGRTEREEARTEEVLKVFQGIGDLAKRYVEPPTAPCWEAGRERSSAGDDGHEQDRCELEAAGWKRLERSDGQNVWVEPDNGLMYQRAVALAIVREGNNNEASAP
jgi:hypothetical protein